MGGFGVDCVNQLLLDLLNIVQSVIDQDQVKLAIWVQHPELLVGNLSSLPVWSIISESQIDQVDLLGFWQSEVEHSGD
jgi:hypothetical protein